MNLAIPKLAAALATLAMAVCLAIASPANAAPTLMILNVAVDLTGITGDKGKFVVVCKVTQASKVKENFIDGRTEVQLVHDAVSGGYVARYQGTVKVEMSQQYVSPQYDFAKLDTYWCQLSMASDQTKQSGLPTISGSLPTTATTPPAEAAKSLSVPGASGQ